MARSRPERLGPPAMQFILHTHQHVAKVLKLLTLDNSAHTGTSNTEVDRVVFSKGSSERERTGTYVTSLSNSRPLGRFLEAFSCLTEALCVQLVPDRLVGNKDYQEIQGMEAL